MRHKSVNTPLSHERLVGGLQYGGRGTHVTHFVQLYPQPLYTASQVRTTCRSWDEGVLTDVCLTGVLTDLCLTLYIYIYIHTHTYTHTHTHTHIYIYIYSTDFDIKRSIFCPRILFFIYIIHNITRNNNYMKCKCD